MSRAGTSVRAMADLARVSNLPTCLGNVLVGCALGAGENRLPWLPVVGVFAGITLLYTGGMILNDVVDAAHDRRSRPQRPIPDGRISRRGAGILAAGALATGTALLSFWGAATFLLGLALIVTIVIYDVFHKKSKAYAVLMGVCRGLVYLAAAAAIAWPPGVGDAYVFAGSSGLYVVLLTLVASAETNDSPGALRLLSIVMPVVVLAMFFVHPPGQLLWSVVTGVCLLIWLVRAASFVLLAPARTMQAVQSWLAGICLVDAFFLTLLDRGWLALIAVGCFAMTEAGHRRIRGT